MTTEGTEDTAYLIRTLFLSVSSVVILPLLSRLRLRHSGKSMVELKSYKNLSTFTHDEQSDCGNKRMAKSQVMRAPKSMSRSSSRGLSAGGVSKPWFLALLSGFLFGAASFVCADWPLFRFALERWPAEDYEVVVFHRGPLESEEQECVDLLKDSPSRLGANVAVATVDVLNPMEDPMQTLWNAQTNALSPWLVVRAPKSDENTPPVCVGALKLETIKTLLDSPARRKIAEGLLRGDSAVWVLLECGDAMLDEAAVDVLSAALKELEQQLPLPAPAPGDPPSQSPLPLRVAFSLVRVTRNDPAEALFVNLLLHGEPLSASKPVAFPVFGRGRALAPLAGRHLDEASIEQACVLLVGGCSRETKESPPGKNLLLAANWNSVFERLAPAESKPVLPAPMVPSARAPDPPPAVATTPAQAPALARGGGNVLRVGGVLTAVLVLTMGLLARRLRRGSNSGG